MMKRYTEADPSWLSLGHALVATARVDEACKDLEKSLGTEVGPSSVRLDFEGATIELIVMSASADTPERLVAKPHDIVAACERHSWPTLSIEKRYRLTQTVQTFIANLQNELLSELRSGKITAFGKIGRIISEPYTRIEAVYWNYLNIARWVPGDAICDDGQKIHAIFISPPKHLNRKPIITRTGVAGRPSSLNTVVIPEFDTMAKCVKVPSKISDVGRQLSHLLKSEHPDKPQMTPRSVENAIRGRFNRYQRLTSSSHTSWEIVENFITNNFEKGEVSICRCCLPLPSVAEAKKYGMLHYFIANYGKSFVENRMNREPAPID